jgi:hypothetical protein
MDRFAPNGIVRKRARTCDQRYRQLIGQPTPAMTFIAHAVEFLAKSFKKEQILSPYGRYPKEEPFKRYHYEKDESTAQTAIPYRTEFPHRRTLGKWIAMKKYEWRANLLAQTANCVRLAYARRGDPIIDRYIIEAIKIRNSLGF